VAGRSLQSPGALDALLASLREERFAVGTSEAVKAHRLVAAGRARRDDEWKFALAPIFARDPDQQQQFYELYDRWVGAQAPHHSIPLLTHSPVSAVAAPDQVGRRSARIAWLIGAVMLVALLGWPYLVPPRLTVRVTTQPTTGATPQPSQPSQPSPATPPRAALPERPQSTIDQPCVWAGCVTSTPWGWLLFAPVSAWILASLVLAGPLRRAAIYRRERQLTPPYEWPLRIGVTSPRSDDALATVLRMIRRRPTGDARRLDVARSIRATVRDAGCPVLHFEQERRAPEYLFIVQQRHRHDHFAAWVGLLVRILARNGVDARACFYEDDPRLLRLTGSRRPMRLRHVAEAWHPSRAVFVGDAASWLDPFTARPGEWTRIVADTWVERVLLTPTRDRGAAENRVRRVLPVRPFSMAQLAALPDLFETPLLARRDDTPLGGGLPLPPDHVLEHPSNGRDVLLRAFFTPAVFEWLCACAIYSELEWELTIALADVVAPDGSLRNERSLLSLIRLPWFRYGRIPDPWRPVLVAALPAERRDRVRQALLERLQSNPAPPGTFARGKQTLDMAAQRYWLDPKRLDARARLERTIRLVPDADVRADRLLTETVDRWASESAWPDASLRWSRFVAGGGPIKLASVAALTIAIGLALSRGTEPIPLPVPPSPATPAFTQPVIPDEPQVAPSPAGAAAEIPSTVTREAFVEQVPSSVPTPAPPPAQTPDVIATVPPAAAPPEPVQDQPSPAAGVTPLEFTPLPPVEPAPKVGGAASPVPAPVDLEPSRQVIPFASSSTAKGSLIITALTGTHYPLPNLTDLTIERQGKTVFERKNIRFDRYLDGAIEITGVPDGEYRVEVDPAGVSSQRSTVVVRDGAAKRIDVVARGVSIDAKDVRAVAFPPYDALPDALRSRLEASTAVTGFPGTSGRRLFEALSDLQRAALFNIFAKASQVRFPASDRSAWDYVTALTDVRSDRVFATTDVAMHDEIRASTVSGLVSEVPAALHQPPLGFSVANSYRTREKAGSLQITVFRGLDNDAQMTVDMDIDINSGASRVFGIISRTLTRSIVHPYDVQQVLISTQLLDPGYRLITNPELADAVTKGRGGGAP
jgi:hypothetical protein